MSEVVKKGVEQAQEELRKEADNQIWQEGILRWGRGTSSRYEAVAVEGEVTGYKEQEEEK